MAEHTPMVTKTCKRIRHLDDVKIVVGFNVPDEGVEMSPRTEVLTQAVLECCDLLETRWPGGAVRLDVQRMFANRCSECFYNLGDDREVDSVRYCPGCGGKVEDR